MKTCSQGHQSADSLRFCGACGELLPENPSPFDSFPSINSINGRSSGGARKLLVRIGLVVIAFSIIGAIFGDSSSSNQLSSSTEKQPSSSSSSSTVEVDWFPSGYTEVEQGIAMRWLKSNEYECSSLSDGCWGIMVLAQEGCGSLYVELALLDSSGVNVGMTNDVASGVSPGGRARLVFEDYGNGASKAQVADVSCY